MLAWRVLVEKGRQSNHTFSQPDLIIAATAVHHGMVVVSRDTTIFDRAGVSVYDPWHA